MPSAVFVDRDGVLNRMVQGAQGEDSPHRPEDLRLLPGAAAAVRALNERAVPVVLASNQPGIAKGKATTELLRATTEKLLRLLAEEGARLDGVYYCLHHPEAELDEYRVLCDCRKPRPGLLLMASHELGISLARAFMVGDRMTDVLAGRAAGCRTVLVGTADDAAGGGADHLAADLGEAVGWILAQDGDRMPSAIGVPGC